MTEHDRRIARLPKWAQDLIRRQERELEQALSAAAPVLSEENADSPYAVETMASGRSWDRRLPASIMGVLFRLDGRRTGGPQMRRVLQARVSQAHVQPGQETAGFPFMLRVSALDGNLVVHPGASNVVYVGVER